MSDFDEALTQQIPRLRRYARALTHDAAWADDLVQDTLERALRRQWLFRINSNLPAWLFTILYRLYLNSATRGRTIQADGSEPEPVAAHDMDLRLDMQRALQRLSPEHRAIVILIGLEQVGYKEAARILDIPAGTVMSRLSRAREQLRRLMAEPPSSASTGPHQQTHQTHQTHQTQQALLTRIK